jgi:SAM-dependent methyltransferase
MTYRPRAAALHPLLLFLLVATGSAQPNNPPRHNLAPYVPSPQNVVEKMLEVAQIKPGELVYDLGSGDGRVLITAVQKYQARGVGVEISEKAVKTSLQRIKELSLEDRIRIIHGHLLEVDLSPADVVTIYLLTKSNELLRPNLERYLKPGARVVSHDYEIRGWKPVKVEEVESYKRMHRLFLYEIGKHIPERGKD